MPLVRSRRSGGWMDAQAARQQAVGRPTLARSWPGDLPDRSQVPARLPAAPGTRPTRGWPDRTSLALGGAAVTGNPANSDGRSSVYGIG